MKKKKVPEQYVPEILYVHVEEDDEWLTAGDWFHNTGSDYQCAQAAQTEEGKWNLYIDSVMSSKPLPTNPVVLDSIDACKAFVSEYFEQPVVDENPADFQVMVKRACGISDDDDEDDESSADD